MLEFRKVGESKYGDEYGLFINGALLGQTRVSTHGRNSADGEFWEVEIYGNPDYELLAAHSFFELPDRIESLSIKNIFGISPALSSISINYPYMHERLAGQSEDDSTRFNRPHFEIEFNFTPDLRGWKNDYSPAEYVGQFIEYAKAREQSGIEYKQYGDIDSYGFSACFRVASAMLQIKMEVERGLEALKEYDRGTLKELAAKRNPHSVMKVFDFPEAVRVPCEQYLIYFVQFLKDLGIEATSDLRHQAGRVLFTVTPDDRFEALDKLREALEVYLRLPASPVSDVPPVEYEIAVQRLAVNVQHLQGQLLLARATLQSQEATIQLQQLTINQQRLLLSGEIVAESVVESVPKPQRKDEEEVIGGVLALTEYEGKGFKIKLPEIFRRLKRYFDE